MDERGKFGEHEKCVRVARGAAESNSSFLSDNKDLREEAFHCDRVQNSQTAQKKSEKTSLLTGQKHATFYTLVWAWTFDSVNR